MCIGCFIVLGIMASTLHSSPSGLKLTKQHAAYITVGRTDVSVTPCRRQCVGYRGVLDKNSDDGDSGFDETNNDCAVSRSVCRFSFPSIQCVQQYHRKTNNCFPSRSCHVNGHRTVHNDDGPRMRNLSQDVIMNIDVSMDYQAIECYVRKYSYVTTR